LIGIEVLRQASSMLGESLFGQSAEEILRAGEGLVPLPFRVDLAEQQSGKRILVIVRELGCLIKGSLKKLRHAVSFPSDR